METSTPQTPLPSQPTENIPQKEEKESTITTILSYFLTLPLFIIAHKLVPELNWFWHTDRILLFIIILLLVQGLLEAFKPLVLIGFWISVLWLGWGSIWGEYGFKSFYRDYRAMLFTMAHSPVPQQVILSAIKPFPHKAKILNAIDYAHPEVRNFAVESTRLYFADAPNDERDRTIIHAFAVFKRVKKGWKYVDDPVSREYFAKASETVNHLAGDCDDYSIFMAACIKAIGGRVRLVHTHGHLHPELYIGSSSNMERVNFLVKQRLFPNETRNKRLHYTTDNHGDIWLNLDYTANYPGGPYMSTQVLNVLVL